MSQKNENMMKFGISPERIGIIILILLFSQYTHGVDARISENQSDLSIAGAAGSGR